MSSSKAQPVPSNEDSETQKENVDVTKSSEEPEKSQASSSNDGTANQAQSRLDRFKVLKARAVSFKSLN